MLKAIKRYSLLCVTRFLNHYNNHYCIISPKVLCSYDTANETYEKLTSYNMDLRDS